MCKSRKEVCKMINMNGKAPFATLAYLKRNVQVSMGEVFRYRPDELWDEEFISHFKKLINDNPGYIKMICLNKSVKNQDSLLRILE